MNRFVPLFAPLFALMTMASGAALAADPAFCTSMCDSQQRECRASAQVTPLEERLGAPDMDQRNTLARTAKGEVPSQSTRALDAAGSNGRRQARLGACDTTYQRCTRSCAAPAEQPAVLGQRG